MFYINILIKIILIHLLLSSCVLLSNVKTYTNDELCDYLKYKHSLTRNEIQIIENEIIEREYYCKHIPKPRYENYNSNLTYQKNNKSESKLQESIVLPTTGIGDVSYFGPEAEFFLFDDIKFFLL